MSLWIFIIVPLVLVLWLLAQRTPHSERPKIDIRAVTEPQPPAVPHGRVRSRRKRSKAREKLLEGRMELNGPGDFRIEVVGESHYQPALTTIVDKPGYAQKTCDAVLVPEPSNPYDSNAVRVDINGSVVGYLPRKYAALYRSFLTEKGFPTAEAVCRARIYGGGEKKMYGVWLDI